MAKAGPGDKGQACDEAGERMKMGRMRETGLFEIKMSASNARPLFDTLHASAENRPVKAETAQDEPCETLANWKLRQQIDRTRVFFGFQTVPPLTCVIPGSREVIPTSRG